MKRGYAADWRKAVMADKRNHINSVFNLRRDGLVCLLLVASILVCYWQVADYDFISFDDSDYITENHHIRAGLTLESIKWSLSATHSANWHPLTWLSHMLDIQLFGMNAGRHHLTNLIFHIANSLLLFLVLKRMTGAFWRSCLVAVLFALHPLNVESVAWISERKNVLSTFFWILTMGSYTLYVERPNVLRYIPVFLFLFLGLTAKPMLVTLPFVLLLLDYWPFGRFQFGASGAVINKQQKSIVFRLLWEKIPFFILIAASCIVTFFVEQGGGSVVSLERYPLNVRIASALVAYVAYIGKMFWPVHLAVLYPYPEKLFMWEIAGACLILLVISLSVIRVVKRHPYFTVGWLWYVGTLIPVIGLVQVGSQAMADRYAYVPLIGLFMMIAWGLYEMVSKHGIRKITVSAAALALCSALMTATYVQVRYWANSLTLFRYTVEHTDNNAIMHCSLGLELANQGKIAEAIRHYSEALRINPNYEKAHNNLGIALKDEGRVDEAIDHYLQALRIKPDFEEAHNNLGNAFLKQGKAAKAIKHFKEALRLNPEFTDAYNSLGTALIRTGNTDEAIEYFRKALQIDPNCAGTYVNLGGALIGMGRIDEAIVYFRKALQIEPSIPEVHVNLGVALANKGEVEEAVDHFRKALQINPDNAEAQHNLNNILVTLGKIDGEIAKIKEELTFNPQSPALYFDLGNMYKLKGKLDTAKDYYKRAVSLQPEFPEALYELAKIYISRSEYEKAMLIYHKMITFLPDNPVVYYNIACIYARQNKPEPSVAWLQKAVDKGFDDWEHIKTDSDLDNIRSASEFQIFVKGH